MSIRCNRIAVGECPICARGAPLDRRLEVILLAVLMPALWYLCPSFLRTPFARATIGSLAVGVGGFCVLMWRTYLSAPEEADQVDAFLHEYEEIRRTGIATNVRLKGARFAIATTVHNQSGGAVASVTLVGPTADVQPRAKKLTRVLLRHADSWPQRMLAPREAI